MSRIFTREVLDGGRNLERYWPNSRLWTQKKIDIINGWIARGFALGTASHGIGAARALQVNAEAGAWAALRWQVWRLERMA